MARRGPFLPRDIAEAAIDDTTPAPVAMPRAFEVDAVDQEASGFGRGPRAFQVASYDEGYQPPAYNPSQPDPMLERTPGLTPLETYQLANQGSLGFFTGENPMDSLRRAQRGLEGTEQFSQYDLGFVRNLDEGDPLREPLARIGGQLVDPINLATLGQTGAAKSIAFGIGAEEGARALARQFGVSPDTEATIGAIANIGGNIVGPSAINRAAPVARRVAGNIDEAINPAVFPPEASQIGRVPGTDPAWTAGVLGEEVGPTGNVTEMLLGREPRVGENVNARRYFTNLGRSQQTALAADEQAAFRSASERAIAGADEVAGIGGGADVGSANAARQSMLAQATDQYVADALPKRTAGFIRPDGALVVVPDGMEHDAFAKTILGPGSMMNDLLDEGWLTVRHGLYGPDDLVLRVGRTRPSARQLRAVDEIAPGNRIDYYIYGSETSPYGASARQTTVDQFKRDVNDVFKGRAPSDVARFHLGGGADLTQDEFARLAAKKAAGEALNDDEITSLMNAAGRSMGAMTDDEIRAAREALYNGPVPTDMREVDTGLIEGVRSRLGAPTGATVEDALSRARQVGGGAAAAVGDAPLTPTGAQSVTPQTYTAPPTLRRLFGARDIVPGETRGALERVSEEGRFRADDPIVTPALRVRDEARRAVVNQATRVTAQARTLINRAGFEFDDAGRIKALAGIDPEVPGAPTLRDVAARLPRYAEALTPPQRQALEQIRELVAPYRQALDEVAQAESALTGKPSSIKIGSRADVLDGGFYIPRGNAETEALAEIAAKRVGRSGGRVGGRQGFERSAQFASEAEGIAAGYRYTPIDEALASYVRGAGNRALDRHTANYFLSRVDESGQRIAQSRADRLDPELRGAVESVRARIASRLQTLRNQTVRGRAQGQAAAGTAREAQRLDRLALSAETRAVLKKAKIEEFDVSTPDAILESFPNMDTLRAQADATRARLALKGGERGLAQRLGEQEALKSLRSAAEQSGGDLDRMLNIINEYGEESARYAEYSAPRGRMRGATAPAFGTPERVQWELDRKASGINKQRGGMRGGGVDAPFVGPDASYRVYDDILAHALDNSAIWASRTPGTQSSIRAADRELKVLLREARRAGRTAQTVGNRAGRTAAARQGTLAEIDALRTELDALTPRWQRAQEIAAQTPRDKATIPLAGLDAYAFPYEMADEAARVLQRETRDPGTVDAALRAVNSVFRGIQATGEMSYLGIQNLMGTVADPVAGYRAAKASTQAWLNAGDEVLGDFIARFDAKAVDKGLPNSERWAASGLRLGASGTEFRVGGRAVPERIANVVDSRPAQLATAPVRSLVKRADRGFGVAGDTMRLELADTLAEEAKLAGRTLDEKTLRSIAETANRVTGWTPQRAFGDWGELVNFAPRYLAARARALGQLASADPYKRDLARRIVGRYLMIATTMTIAANYLNGEETDYHPFSGKNGPTYDPREAEYKNPNFMRVMNVARRDWSLLGPMDALLGTAVGAGSLLTNPTGSPKEALERLRSIFTSPAASAGLDWVVFGENFEGDKLTLDSEAGLRDLMGRVLPFASGDLGSSAVETARLAQEGRGVDAGVEAVAGIGQGFLGGRGSRETAREGVERGRFAEMTPDQQFKAIPAQAWMVTVKQAPEQYKAVSQYATAGAFYQALVDEYTKGWIERGASPLEAEAKARASAERHPVYRAYNNARNYYEDWWTSQNPEQRQADAEAQLNLPPSERRNMPRQPERRIIQEATR